MEQELNEGCRGETGVLEVTIRYRLDLAHRCMHVLATVPLSLPANGHLGVETWTAWDPGQVPWNFHPAPGPRLLVSRGCSVALILAGGSPWRDGPERA
jgi:hypothetical protein